VRPVKYFLYRSWSVQQNPRLWNDANEPNSPGSVRQWRSMRFPPKPTTFLKERREFPTETHAARLLPPQ